MERINWIDWAKALGITLVVMGHSNYSFPPHLVGMIFMIHMPLFFFISGYLFNAEGSYMDLAINNWKRLVVPYICFNVISALFVLADFGIKAFLGREVDWNAVFWTPLWHTLLGQSGGGLFCGVTWFLLALVWCKFLMHAICKGPWGVRIGVVVLWAILLSVRLYSGSSFYYSIDCGLVGFIWFGLGFLARQVRAGVSIPILVWLLLIPIGAFICYYGLMHNGQCNYIAADVKGVMGVIYTGAGLLSFFGVCKLLDGVHSKLIVRISKASLLIMCLHMLIMLPMQKILHYQYHSWLTLLGDISIVLIITAFYPIIEKYAPILTGGRK